MLRALLLLLAVGVTLCLDVRSTFAATFGVTTTNDEGQLSPVGPNCANTPSGQCSLRSAVQAANAQGGGPHTIMLAGGSAYRLTVAGQDEEAAATGDLDITASISIMSGAGGAAIEAGPDAATAIDRVFDVRAGGALTLTGLTVRHGNSGSVGGGAIRNGATLTLLHVTVHDSQAAGQGAGIQSTGGGVLTVQNSTIRDNDVIGVFGGGGVAATGSFITPHATLAIRNSVITGNAASFGGGVYLLYTDGEIANTTVHGNSVGSSGGGVTSDAGADVTLSNVTVTANTTSFANGGVTAANTGVLRLRNSIFYGNAGNDCWGNGISEGYNIIGASVCGAPATGDTNQNPLLGALQDNGGFTPTRALGGGSPAINAGNPAGCTDTAGATLTVDQRGVSRTSGGRCDMGAFEVGSGGPVIASIPDQAVLEDAISGPIPLLLADSDTAGSTSFTITPLSSDGAVIPTGNVVVSGAGASRQLAVTPAANASGATTITLNIRDVANNQLDEAFVVTVTSVNDAPTFTSGANVTVLEDSGPQSLPWATAISPGPANEAVQSVTFAVVGNTNPALFSAGPFVASNGTLTFTPAANASGSAQLSVQLSDDGGTANGGANVSTPTNLTITVTPINDPPVVTLPGAASTYTAGAAPVVIDAAATAADVDSTNLDGGQLVAQIGSGAGASDFLEIRDNAGSDPVDVNGNAVIVGGVQIGTFTAGSGGAPLQLALNANAKPTRVQAVVRNLTFRTAATASAGARTVTVQLSDGDGGTSGVATQTVNVTQPSPPSPCASKPTVTRPNVRLQPAAGGGRLDVTVEAAPIDGQTNNALVSLRFGQFQNARVTHQGAPVAAGATVTLPSNTIRTTFSVERQTPGQATHVPFTVVDSCGDWETFVGGGANAGF